MFTLDLSAVQSLWVTSLDVRRSKSKVDSGLALEGSAKTNGEASRHGGAAMYTHELGLGFGDAVVLNSITLNVEPSKVLALVGATGSGKTTLLRSLNRMNDRVRGCWHKGKVALEGSDIYDSGVDPLIVRRRIGMVFQHPNPFPMSIFDNVVAGVKAHKLAPRSQLKSICEERLREVGLWDAIASRTNDSPFRLSGGQQQLLCLARALAVQPEVLLLDEPTSSLDPHSTEAVEHLLTKLKARVTVVIVTHNLAQARRISDSTAFFQKGHLVEVGPTSEMFASPHEPETAEYLGGQVA
jgi:phosphate transport system ATP-binding protein